MFLKEKTLLKNTFSLYLLQISNYVFNLLAFPYLTRVLGSECYGIIVFANSVMAYFTLFIEFGFLMSGTNSVSLHFNDRQKLGNITFGIILAKFFLCIVGFVLLFFITVYVPKVAEYKLYFYLSYFGIVLTIFLPDFLFRGLEIMSVLAWRVIISKLVYVVCIFCLVHKEKDFYLVPVATIASNVFSILTTWIEIARKKLIEVKTVKMTEVFAYLRESQIFFLSRAASSVYTTLNTVLLGFLYPADYVGNYGAANTLVNAGRSFFSPVADSLYPYMVKKRNLKLVKKIILIAEPIIVCGCAVLYLFSPLVIKIVCGQGYENAVPVFRASLPLISITLPLYVCGYPVLASINKIKMANVSVIIASIFHIAFLLVMYLLKKLDAITLVLLTFCTESVILGIRFAVIYKTVKGASNKNSA